MKKNIRTDLALEAREIGEREAGKIKGITAEEWEHGHIKVTQVDILNEEGANAIGKAQGRYVTIEAPNLKYDEGDYKKVCSVICDELKKLTNISSDTVTLVAGLGNRDITPDALGSRVIDNLFVTNHMKEYFGSNVSSVCAIAPGVLGTTGIETVDIIKSVSDKIKPDLVIAIDALAAADINRLSTTIQIADTGIQPGAGVGNDRKGLNEETLGVKVIAMGVPTVIDASNISDMEIPEELAPLMVTTKDIDVVIDKMSKTIATGINLALHENMTVDILAEIL